jgi:hypothetical protein
MLGTRIQHQLRLVQPATPLTSHRTIPPHDDLDVDVPMTAKTGPHTLSALHRRLP